MKQSDETQTQYTALSPDEYVAQRLDDQINWYDSKSVSNQKWWRWLSYAEVTGAASIPFLAGYAGSSKVVFAIGLVGMAVAVLASLKGLLQLQENWIEYRTTCESLRKEKYLFQTQTEPYDGSEPFPLLVQRVETLISKENTNWGQYLIDPSHRGVPNG